MKTKELILIEHKIITRDSSDNLEITVLASAFKIEQAMQEYAEAYHKLLSEPTTKEETSKEKLNIPCVRKSLFCGICEEENDHRTLPDGSLECEGCGNIAKL